MVNQQGIISFQQIHRKKITTTRNTITNIIRNKSNVGWNSLRFPPQIISQCINYNASPRWYNIDHTYPCRKTLSALCLISYSDLRPPYALSEPVQLGCLSFSKSVLLVLASSLFGVIGAFVVARHQLRLQKPE